MKFGFSMNAILGMTELALTSDARAEQREVSEVPLNNRRMRYCRLSTMSWIFRKSKPGNWNFTVVLSACATR